MVNLLESMFAFGKVSESRLSQADFRLQLIFQLAIRRTKVDFGIACTYRSIEDQKKAFKEGKSKIDGVTQTSKHNALPARAVDYYGWVDGKMDYTLPVMCYLAGVIEAVASELGIPVRWGGNWNGDGVILVDQDFDDTPHIELM